MDIDPILFEILQENLISIVREMRANLTRSAYSSVIYEGRDFSCVIMDAQGRLVAQSEDNPSHVFPIPWSVRAMLKRYSSDIAPGDIFFHNDPYTGGTHLNDVAVIFPLFHEGRLSLFPVVRAHWSDVGGMSPGSLSGNATEILQEGVRMPIVRAFRRGSPNAELLDIAFANMRLPAERRGDLDAVIGTCRMAQDRLDALVRRYSLEVLETYTEQTLSLAEQRMRRAIHRVPDGEYYYDAYLDSGGDSLEPVVVRAGVTVSGEKVIIDFSGSSSQRPGPLNAGPAVAPSGAFIILKSVLDPTGPINHGAFAPIEFVNPPGSVVNAAYPYPCGGFSEIRRCAESAVAGALARALPERITGDIKGTANHVTISGMQFRGDSFIFYEYPAGGTGAYIHGDGNNAVRAYTEGDFSSIQSIESLEQAYPLEVRCCSLRCDSGGEGRMRGGLGMLREVVVRTEKASLSILSDKNIIPPFGVLGGHQGAPNRFTVKSGEASLVPGEIPGKVSRFPLQDGDVVVIETSGGGGYGDPLERDPERVLADLANGLISPERAWQGYGLVFQEEGTDQEKTAQARQILREQRIHLCTRAHTAMPETGSQRRGGVNPEMLKRMTAEEGALAEIVCYDSAPLRVWLQAVAAAGDDEILLDASDIQRMALAEGQVLEIRIIQTER